MYSAPIHSTPLSERDIRRFLAPTAPSSRTGFRLPKAKQVLSILAVPLLLAATYGILNYNALLRMYTPVDHQDTVLAAPSLPAPAAALAPEATPTPWPDPTIPENSISVAGVNIAAPINWDTELVEKTIQDKLLVGVAHLAGTAKPGQQGYVIITGHSSNYPWIKGQYNTIFAPLHKTKVGQSIIVNYQNHEYRYDITRIYEIKPDQLEVLQGGEGSGIRLITCTPVGTSLRRLVVEATQVSPNPADNVPFEHQIEVTSVPGAR